MYIKINSACFRRDYVFTWNNAVQIVGNGSEGTISHQKFVFLSRHCTRGTCTITFIYGIQSVHEMSAGMNLEFVFSFNRIHCNYCHSANDRVFVLGWGIGWCCRPGRC